MPTLAPCCWWARAPGSPQAALDPSILHFLTVCMTSLHLSFLSNKLEILIEDKQMEVGCKNELLLVAIGVNYLLIAMNVKN